MAELPKTKKIWDNYRVVGEFRKSADIKFVVAIAVRDGVKYINIREFYHRKKTDTWSPGKDGVTIPVAFPIEKGTKVLTPLNDFVHVLYNALSVIDEVELYDEENAVYVPIKVRKD